MTLRRCWNGETRKSGWFLGSAFGARSAATNRVCWLQSLASVQNLGSSDPYLTKLALDLVCTQTLWTMSLKRGSTASKWVNRNWVIGPSDKTIQWFFLCQSHSTIEFRACKTKGHIRIFQRYFDSLSQQSSLMLFVTSITVDFWISCAAWWSSMLHWC